MTKKLTAIPLPTMPIPDGTVVRTRTKGLTWKPKKATTKDANVALFHARRYNMVLGGKSILYQIPNEES